MCEHESPLSPHPCCPHIDPALFICQLVPMPKTTKAARVHWADALAGAPSNPAQKKPPARRTILRTEARELIDGKFGECNTSRKSLSVLT